MAETPTDVLVAGYQNIDEATQDFEALVALVKNKQVSIKGVILVTQRRTGASQYARRGTAWGARGWVGVAASGSPWGCSRRPCWPRSESVRSQAA